MNKSTYYYRANVWVPSVNMSYFKAFYLVLKKYYKVIRPCIIPSASGRSAWLTTEKSPNEEFLKTLNTNKQIKQTGAEEQRSSATIWKVEVGQTIRSQHEIQHNGARCTAEDTDGTDRASLCHWTLQWPHLIIPQTRINQILPEIHRA